MSFHNVLGSDEESLPLVPGLEANGVPAVAKRLDAEVRWQARAFHTAA